MTQFQGGDFDNENVKVAMYIHGLLFEMWYDWSDILKQALYEANKSKQISMAQWKACVQIRLGQISIYGLTRSQSMKVNDLHATHSQEGAVQKCW